MRNNLPSATVPTNIGGDEIGMAAMNVYGQPPHAQHVYLPSYYQGQMTYTRKLSLSLCLSLSLTLFFRYLFLILIFISSPDYLPYHAYVYLLLLLLLLFLLSFCVYIVLSLLCVPIHHPLLYFLSHEAH